MKANITLSLDLETIKAMDDLKERFKMNRSKMIRYVFTFFEHKPEQLEKVLKGVENWKKHEKRK